MAKTRVRGLYYPDELQHLPGFVDTSWGNDVCDSISFELPETGLVWLWVDHEDLERREISDHRYALMLPADDRVNAQDIYEALDDASVGFETDDPEELLVFIMGIVCLGAL